MTRSFIALVHNRQWNPLITFDRISGQFVAHISVPTAVEFDDQSRLLRIIGEKVVYVLGFRRVSSCVIGLITKLERVTAARSISQNR